MLHYVIRSHCEELNREVERREEQGAESREQRAESREQRAERREQREESREMVTARV
jgi:hypothetical protein